MDKCNRKLVGPFLSIHQVVDDYEKMVEGLNKELKAQEELRRKAQEKVEQLQEQLKVVEEALVEKEEESGSHVKQISKLEEQVAHLELQLSRRTPPLAAAVPPPPVCAPPQFAGADTTGPANGATAVNGSSLSVAAMQTFLPITSTSLPATPKSVQQHSLGPCHYAWAQQVSAGTVVATSATAATPSSAGITTDSPTVSSTSFFPPHTGQRNAVFVSTMSGAPPPSTTAANTAGMVRSASGTFITATQTTSWRSGVSSVPAVPVVGSAAAVTPKLLTEL